ncbi:signal transduction histidine kinase [Actinocrispum wychmicini]|uniref:histidine kinase n=1 Tax=Actinocrispum wychmicini TaxID=1213861 RepID=A0A4R2J6U9_9PSEU|nr:signal transduction histidine kinase [Actinocrispum wychmicini]
MWRRAINTDPETGVLVRVLVTAVLIIALATSRVPAGWMWGAIAGAFACWLFWAVFASRLPGVSLVALTVCSLVSTALIGTGSEAAIVLTALSLPTIATHVRPPWWVIGTLVAVEFAVLVASMLLWGSSAAQALALLGLMAVLTLVGAQRRMYRIAQDERAQFAALDERARIAREMHDVLAHSLGALSVQLEVAEALLSEKNDPVKALERVRQSRRLAVEGLAEARRAVAALRSDVPPLPEAMAILVESYRRDHQAKIRLGTQGQPRSVSAPATVSLLATAREALTNAAKHAPNTPVDVMLDYGPDAVSLRVTNAAQGGPEEEITGYGLSGMRERIALVGGTLTAGYNATSWRVVAEVPE